MADRNRKPYPNRQERATRKASRTRAQLAAEVRALRTTSWGALAPRRRQRLAMYLRQLRETAGESMAQVGQAAARDGVTLSDRQLVDLESMRAASVARKRQWVNMETTAWLLARYGKTLADAWAFMTSEERSIESVSAAQSAEHELAAAYNVLPVPMQQQLLAFAHTLVSNAGLQRAVGMQMPQAAALVDAETAARYEAIRAMDAVKAAEELRAAAAEADAEREQAERERDKRRRAN